MFSQGVLFKITVPDQFSQDSQQGKPVNSTSVSTCTNLCICAGEHTQGRRVQLWRVEQVHAEQPEHECCEQSPLRSLQLTRRQLQEGKGL